MRRAAFAAPILAATLAAGWSSAPAQGADGDRSLVWENGDIFTGAFRDGKPNGPGSFRAADGSVHSGDWRDGCLLTGDGHRIAVFTRLRDCPPLPASAGKRRHAPLPLPDFR